MWEQRQPASCIIQDIKDIIVNSLWKIMRKIITFMANIDFQKDTDKAICD